MWIIVQFADLTLPCHRLRIKTSSGSSSRFDVTEETKIYHQTAPTAQNFEGQQVVTRDRELIQSRARVSSGTSSR